MYAMIWLIDIYVGNGTKLCDSMGAGVRELD